MIGNHAERERPTAPRPQPDKGREKAGDGRRPARVLAALVLAFAPALAFGIGTGTALPNRSLGDTVYLKNGMVLRGLGTPDKDQSLLYIWDGLKRVIVRDSKVEKIVADNSFRTGEHFELIQPIVVHAGAMPSDVLQVRSTAWDDRGRRRFQYRGRSRRPVNMEQAIIDIGPHIVKFRGIDGFWTGVVDTNQVPRSVVMALLGRVDQKNSSERERVARFLMETGWHPEALKQLDGLIKDFPGSELSERAAKAKEFIIQSQAVQRRAELETRRKAQQPRTTAALLRTFEEKGIATELQLEVREIERRDARQEAADQALGADLRRLFGRLSPSVRGQWRNRFMEVLKAVDEAPDAVRNRFAAWQKSSANVPQPDTDKSEAVKPDTDKPKAAKPDTDKPKAAKPDTDKPEAAQSDEALFALAMSGFVVDQDAALADLNAADALWQARDAVRDYMLGMEPTARSIHASRIESLAWPDGADPVRRLELLARIVRLMPPPRHSSDAAGPGGADAPGSDPTTVTATKAEAPAAVETIRIHRVLRDENAEPTDYAVLLPPEYHPLRRYPAVIVLHSGEGPSAAIGFWAAEAARHGYILIAPEYNLRGQPHDYRYTTSEHAAVELALRDARQRYAVDSDRVFVAGQLIGGNMAWDYGLAHPDLFAGAIVFSGFPAKYVPKYLPHHEKLPLFYVIGELAPAANELIFSSYIKPLIKKTWDVTYIEYQHRGLEAFPEEVGRAFDWMDRHRRAPYPRSFRAYSARASDNRFYGVVLRDCSPGRLTAPEAADMLGKNLNPAEIHMTSSRPSNLVKLDAKGVRRLDLWLGPHLIDFHRRMEVRVQGRSYFKGKVKLEIEPMLEDLRVRGDREQLYWHRIAVD